MRWNLHGYRTMDPLEENKFQNKFRYYLAKIAFPQLYLMCKKSQSFWEVHKKQEKGLSS